MPRRKAQGKTFPGHVVMIGFFPETTAKAGLWAAEALVKLFIIPLPLQPCVCVCVCTHQPKTLINVLLCIRA